MGKKTKLFVTGNGTKLLSSTTLQSMCHFFNLPIFFAKHWEIDIPRCSLQRHLPIPSWSDKSLNNDQGRSNMLQFSEWEAERCKSQEQQSRARVTHHTWHWAVTHTVSHRGAAAAGDHWLLIYWSSLQVLPTANCCCSNSPVNVQPKPCNHFESEECLLTAFKFGAFCQIW